MYTEDIFSIKLMQLNCQYRDLRFGNTSYMKLFHLKERIFDFFRIFSILPHSSFSKKVLLLSSFFNQKRIIDRKLQYSFEHSDELSYKSTGKKVRGKIAVYTSIFGSYDRLLEPMYVSPYCDYFVITDQDVPTNSVWKKIDIDNEIFYNLDNYHKAKYCKMFPHILFPSYEFSIWVDGNVQIIGDLYPLVDRLDETHIIGMFDNPLHDCVYTEAKYNMYQNNVNDTTIMKQINDYQNAGFPKKFGLREFSIIVRKHSDLQCIQLMDQWWKEVNTYTMRDQISFPYVLWKNHLNIDYIQKLGGNWRWNPRFNYMAHNWHIKF